LLDHLLALDVKNEYFLYYRDPKFLGRYANRKNVVEKLLVGRNKLYWDQVRVPLQAHRDKLDIIFHTKFSVPLFSRAKTIMALHGAGWFVHPELFKWFSVLYQRCIMPLYCWKARGLLANSNLTKTDFVRILRVDPKKIRAVHLAADDRFRPLKNDEILEGVRTKHRLPQRFILSVIKHDPRKNFRNLIEAFRICNEKIPCKLVVVGMGCEKYREEYRIHDSAMDKDIVFLGWVEQEDLVALYSLAEFLFFPSLYETFGIPVCEAMACGRPVVVAKTGSLPEIAGDAGLWVDPLKPKEMAEALYSLWTDDGLRRSCAEKAYARSKTFSWSRNATQTLEVFETIANGNELTSRDPLPRGRSRLNEVRSGSSE
jgi:glycosyltransferase involved in cell wall biosynthesis